MHALQRRAHVTVTAARHAKRASCSIFNFRAKTRPAIKSPRQVNSFTPTLFRVLRTPALLPQPLTRTLRNVANELAMAGRHGGGTPEAYQGAVEHALTGLQPFKADIEASIQMQDPLLEQIFAENERWDAGCCLDVVCA